MNYEEYAKRVKQLNPIDDDLLKKMAEDVDFCQEVIRTVLGDEKLVIVELRDQHSIKNLQGRSVILDAHCISGKGVHFNVEVQKSDDDDHQRRVRYNGACITVNITDPGTKFEKVPEVCVIYITKNDFFKKGKTVYHVDRVLRETGDVVYNGFSEIYVNACVRDGTLTSQLMRIFVENDTYDDEQFPATSKRKRYFKENEEGMREMCAIMEEIREDGKSEGKSEGQLELIIRLIRNGKLTVSEGAEELGVTEEELQKKIV